MPYRVLKGPKSSARRLNYNQQLFDQQSHARSFLHEYITLIDHIMSESYLRTARTWLSDFVRTRNESPQQRAQYQALHTEDVEWYDHAFKVRRIGVLATMDVRDCWTQCHDPLEVEVKSLGMLDFSERSGKAAVAEVVWKGRMSNDLCRTMGGEVAVRATGREFETHLCCVFRFDDRGRIRRIDEYYTKNWDEGAMEETYRVVKFEQGARF